MVSAETSPRVPPVRQADADVLIWTPDGTWLQHKEPDRPITLSYVGRISLVSVQAFAKSRGIRFHVHDGRPRGI